MHRCPLATEYITRETGYNNDNDNKTKTTMKIKATTYIISGTGHNNDNDNKQKQQ